MAWHRACRQRACEGAGMRDNVAADKNNEPWTKLEKRYKEYRNPVLILTHGLQTRLCCRSVENHVWKEWHWLGSWAPWAGPTPASAASAQRRRAALVPAHQEWPWLPQALPSPWRCRWRGSGQAGSGQRASGGQAAVVTGLVYASSSPEDTINRMATGRWSVRPDSWVIKLNSSTSWVGGEKHPD